MVSTALASAKVTPPGPLTLLQMQATIRDRAVQRGTVGQVDGLVCFCAHRGCCIGVGVDGDGDLSKVGTGSIVGRQTKYIYFGDGENG